jgi:cell cycle protein kinase DBF2
VSRLLRCRDEGLTIEVDFYDHYFDLLTYLHSRKQRLAAFKSSIASRPVTAEQAQQEWSSYKGRERVLLRKRRTKLKLDQFHILTQVGQGGYGEVYLARHKESHQVVALKKLRKRTLLKMDEVSPPSSSLLETRLTLIAR